MKANAALLVLSMLGLASCSQEAERSDSSFRELQFRRVSSAPGLVSLDPLEIEMERGLAVGARVSAIGDDGEPMDLLDLRSDDNEIFTVDLGPRLGEFVFHGGREGSTTMGVYSDDRHVADIPVTVIEQNP